jgi:triphosphatase
MSSTSPQETEAKFVIQTAALGDRVRTAQFLPKEFALTPATTVTHLDLYLDTEDYALLRDGYALRLRQTSSGYQVTLKGLNPNRNSTLHKRLELEEPLAADATLLAWEEWPQAVREVVSTKMSAGQKLVPICAIRQTRHKRIVTFAKSGEQNGEPFAELSVDEVQVLRVGRPAKEVNWTTAWQEMPVLNTWCELEVELLSGQDEAVLATLSVSLSKRRGIRPMTTSKFERAVVLVHSALIIAGKSVDHLLPELTMGDACRLIWRQQLAQLLLNEAGVRYSDDIEYVHDMRVALRRLRTALRFFGRFFRPKAIRPFRRALAKTGRLLGAVRDRDVALVRLTKDTDPVAKGQSNGLRSLAQTWRKERDQAFRELVTWLDSDDYRRFVKQFSRFCARSGKGLHRVDGKREAAQNPHQVRHVLPAVIIKRYSRVRAFEAIFETDFDTGQSLPPKTLHQLRIQCKFLRYTLEFAQPLLGASGVRLVTMLKQLQNLLGNLNDAAVSQSLLAEERSGEAAVAAESYHASQQAIIDRLQSEVAAALRDFVSPATRRLVAQAVMRI